MGALSEPLSPLPPPSPHSFPSASPASLLPQLESITLPSSLFLLPNIINQPKGQGSVPSPVPATQGAPERRGSWTFLRGALPVLWKVRSENRGAGARREGAEVRGVGMNVPCEHWEQGREGTLHGTAGARYFMTGGARGGLGEGTIWKVQFGRSTAVSPHGVMVLPGLS